MGQAASNTAIFFQEDVTDRELGVAIQKKAATHQPSVRSFNALLLKFPAIAAAVDKTRTDFDAIDSNGDGFISLEEYHAGAEKLGMLPVDSLFAAADIEGNNMINRNEFMVLLALTSLHSHAASTGAGDKGAGEKLTGALGPDVQEAMTYIEDVFCAFDTSKDGFLLWDEMKKMLDESQTPSLEGRESKRLSKVLHRRFAELDKDKSGRISYKEFLIGILSWVEQSRLDEDEEEKPF